MTRPSRHPSDELILDLARGVLEPGRALVVGAHLGACADCNSTLRVAEAVGGILLNELDPTALSPDALALMMARIERPGRASAAASQPADWIRVPSEVRVALARRRRWAAPGVWVASVTGSARSGPRSYLLGVGAGIAVPRHTHKGVELTCVLKGAFEDRGVVYGPGDFQETDETVEHQPRVTRDGECVCLAAADSSLVPRDLIGWLFQPLVRI